MDLHTNGAPYVVFYISIFWLETITFVLLCHLLPLFCCPMLSIKTLSYNSVKPQGFSRLNHVHVFICFQMKLSSPRFSSSFALLVPIMSFTKPRQSFFAFKKETIFDGRKAINSGLSFSTTHHWQGTKLGQSFFTFKKDTVLDGREGIVGLNFCTKQHWQGDHLS